MMLPTEIFLSHADADKEFVVQLTQALRRHGIPGVSPPGCPTCPAINLDAPNVHAATAPVPEPGTMLMFVCGFVGLVLVQKHNRRS